MKGNNELHLNQATMVEALQCWADITFKEPVEVKRVHKEHGTNLDSYVVDVSEKES